MALQNMKETMVRNMESFARELDNVKETIELNQNSLMEGIREKLAFTNYSPTSRRSPSRFEETFDPNTSPRAPETDPVEDEIEELLRESGVTSVDDLMVILQQEEELAFGKYRDVQDQTEEVERLETEVKHMENDLAIQNNRIEELERNNVQVQRDLEDHIAVMHKQILKHETEVKSNTIILNSISESILNLLRNVRNYF